MCCKPRVVHVESSPESNATRACGSSATTDCSAVFRRSLRDPASAVASRYDSCIAPPGRDRSREVARCYRRWARGVHRATRARANLALAVTSSRRKRAHGSCERACSECSERRAIAGRESARARKGHPAVAVESTIAGPRREPKARDPASERRVGASARGTPTRRCRRPTATPRPPEPRLRRGAAAGPSLPALARGEPDSARRASLELRAPSSDARARYLRWFAVGVTLGVLAAALWRGGATATCRTDALVERLRAPVARAAADGAPHRAAAPPAPRRRVGPPPGRAGRPVVEPRVADPLAPVGRDASATVTPARRARRDDRQRRRPAAGAAKRRGHAVARDRGALAPRQSAG